MSSRRKGQDADQLRAEITNRILDQLDGADAEGWSPPWISMAAQGIPSLSD